MINIFQASNQGTGQLRQDRKVIKGAMNFRLGLVIDRHQEKHGTAADEARVLERKLKRFLVLVSLHNDRSYGIKGPVDTH